MLCRNRQSMILNSWVDTIPVIKFLLARIFHCHYSPATFCQSPSCFTYKGKILMVSNLRVSPETVSPSFEKGNSCLTIYTGGSSAPLFHQEKGHSVFYRQVK